VIDAKNYKSFIWYKIRIFQDSEMSSGDPFIPVSRETHMQPWMCAQGIVSIYSLAQMVNNHFSCFCAFLTTCS